MALSGLELVRGQVQPLFKGTAEYDLPDMESCKRAEDHGPSFSMEVTEIPDFRHSSKILQNACFSSPQDHT